MKTIILGIILCFIALPVHAQQAVLNDISIKQGDLNVQNSIVANSQTAIASANAAITAAQAQIAIDNTAITNDTAINAAYIASTAQTASGVNWDYFVTLEPQIPFSTWSKVSTGINWSSIIPTLGINCGGITESAVNWPNWGNCESKGMTPGAPFGGKATGIAAFWCGNGSIAGTC